MTLNFLLLIIFIMTFIQQGLNRDAQGLYFRLWTEAQGSFFKWNACSGLTSLSLFMCLILCWWEPAARRGLGWPIWPNFSCESHWKFDSEFSGEIREVEGGRLGPGYTQEGGRCFCDPSGKAISSPTVRLSNNLTRGMNSTPCHHLVWRFHSLQAVTKENSFGGLWATVTSWSPMHPFKTVSAGYAGLGAAVQDNRASIITKMGLNVSQIQRRSNDK